ncbi:MAG: hypothetical protein ACYC6A_09310 [Armatimonadota bacterium]
MELSPVVRYTDPRYPARDVLDAHPELLRLLPARWQHNALVLAALTSLGMLLAGCRSQSGGGVSAQSDHPATVSPPTAASHIAPIFCRAFPRVGLPGGPMGFPGPAGPVDLSENDAREIIVEEAKKLGFTLQPDAKTLAEVPLVPAKGCALSLVETTSLTLDGVDERIGLAYEFISRDDYPTLLSTRSDTGISRETMEMEAQALRDGLAQIKPPGIYAVFYDPMSSGPVAREELRQQIKDFITWLKAEGVI